MKSPSSKGFSPLGLLLSGWYGPPPLPTNDLGGSRPYFRGGTVVVPGPSSSCSSWVAVEAGIGVPMMVAGICVDFGVVVIVEIKDGSGRSV